jgi:hypothetical protein
VVLNFHPPHEENPVLPSEILGVSPGATAEEAHKAFRARGRELSQLIYSEDAEASRAASDELAELLLALQSYDRPVKAARGVLGALGPGLAPLSRPSGPRALAFIGRIEVAPSAWDAIA